MAKDKTSLMTAKEAARYLRVSRFTLNKLESDSRFVPYRNSWGTPQI